MDPQQMEKIKKLVKKLVLKGFPHAVIVMAGMIIVFFCIDRVNKPMAFMTNEFHKWLSLMLALSGIGYSISYIVRQRRSEREAEIKRRKALQAKRAARANQRPAAARGPVSQSSAPRGTAAKASASRTSAARPQSAGARKAPVKSGSASAVRVSR